MVNGDDRTYRAGKLTIAWQPSGLIGRVSLDGEHWASVEWSEKRQAWCIEDCEGRCLAHVDSIRATAESRWHAEALAEAMILDGRMPTPEQAKAEADERRRAETERAQRQRQQRATRPSELRRRAQRNAKREAEREASSLSWEAERSEHEAQPLYETLDDAFDLGDPDLWKSNSFAALKPRLILHVETALARLAYEDIAYTWRDVKARLDRAKAIYRKLTGAEWAPRLSKMSQLMAQLANMTAAAPERMGADSAGEEARHE
jgi:hypothetical protein